MKLSAYLYFDVEANTAIIYIYIYIYIHTNHSSNNSNTSSNNKGKANRGLEFQLFLNTTNICLVG